MSKQDISTKPPRDDSLLANEARRTIFDNSIVAREEQIRHVRKRKDQTAPPPRMKFEQEGKTIHQRLGGDPINAVALMAACGTTDLHFAQCLVGDLAGAVFYGTPEENQNAVNAALSGLANIEPQNVAEAQLIAQMMATHRAAMTLLGRSMRTEGLLTAQWQSGFAVKLLRTYALQMEALQRYRGKGEQLVRVEHVHVHAGGQAIVGHISSGGGGTIKSEDQFHAPVLEHQSPAAMPALPCQNPQREALPIPSHAERKMSNARRQSRSAKGKSKRL